MDATLDDAREQNRTLTSMRINCTAYQWQSLLIPATKIRWDRMSRPEDEHRSQSDERSDEMSRPEDGDDNE